MKHEPGAKAKGASSTRGEGLEHARLKPKKLRDTKRAKTKPAIGHLQKSQRETLAVKKVDTAQRSRSKPVKRAVSKTGAKSKTAARGSKRR